MFSTISISKVMIFKAKLTIKIEDIYENPQKFTSIELPPKLEPKPSQNDEISSSDEIRTDEESIAKEEFVKKVRRKSETSKSISPDSIPDLEQAELCQKPKSIKKERIEAIFKEEPMSEPEIICIDD